ncbi:MAG: methyltransferase FkbM [Flavobacteriaceae bacterium]|nr:MAG: methyltransferase FkbM [Flavobacteriaceae bacterium]
MIFIYNKTLLFIIRLFNKFRIGYGLRRKTLCCKLILENNYKLKSNFNFIQIGANDGVSFDFLYDFLIERNSRGIVIEPIKEYFEELCKNYKNYPKILKINKAVHPYKKKIEIYKIDKKKADKYPDWVKGIASLNKNHHKKTKISSDDIIIEKVQTDTLMNIIDENYNYNYIDFIQIDTEGFDYEVIKMIDFNTLKPSLLKVEYINLSKEDKTNLKQMLRQNKYFIIREGEDLIGVDLTKIKLY